MDVKPGSSLTAACGPPYRVLHLSVARRMAGQERGRRRRNPLANPNPLFAVRNSFADPLRSGPVCNLSSAMAWLITALPGKSVSRRAVRRERGRRRRNPPANPKPLFAIRNLLIEPCFAGSTVQSVLDPVARRGLGLEGGRRRRNPPACPNHSSRSGNLYAGTP